MNSNFTLELGPKNGYENHPMSELHHKNNYIREILVNFEDGREFSLGWISTFHDMFSGKLAHVVLMDDRGDKLPGEESRLHPTVKAALARAENWLKVYLGGAV